MVTLYFWAKLISTQANCYVIQHSLVLVLVHASKNQFKADLN